MKNLYVKGIQAYLGKEIQELFYLENLTHMVTESGKWQECVFLDRTGRLNGKIWSQNIKPDTVSYCGSIVKVTGVIEIYRDVYYINVSSVVRVAEKYDVADFSSTVEASERKSLLERLGKLINMVTDPPLHKLLLMVYKKERLPSLCLHSGSLLNHHRYRGGYLEYAVEVAENACALLELCEGMQRAMFHDAPKANADLVVAGALLHGIGKLSQISDGIFPKCTYRGFLVGFDTDSVVTVTLLNNRMKDKVRDFAELLHIITSTGNPSALPKTVEALIVCEAMRNVVNLNAFYMVFKDFDFSHPDEQARDKVMSDFFGRKMLRGGDINE